jgi:hypothetical protein
MKAICDLPERWAQLLCFALPLARNATVARNPHASAIAEGKAKSGGKSLLLAEQRELHAPRPSPFEKSKLRHFPFVTEQSVVR